MPGMKKGSEEKKRGRNFSKEESMKKRGKEEEKEEEEVTSLTLPFHTIHSVVAVLSGPQAENESIAACITWETQHLVFASLFMYGLL